jgi:hypothetical protein
MKINRLLLLFTIFILIQSLVSAEKKVQTEDFAAKIKTYEFLEKNKYRVAGKKSYEEYVALYEKEISLMSEKGPANRKVLLELILLYDLKNDQNRHEDIKRHIQKLEKDPIYGSVLASLKVQFAILLDGRGLNKNKFNKAMAKLRVKKGLTKDQLEFIEAADVFIYFADYHKLPFKKNTSEMMDEQITLLKELPAQRVLLNVVLIKAFFEIAVIRNNAPEDANIVYQEILDLMIFSGNFEYASYYMDKLKKLNKEGENDFRRQLTLKKIQQLIVQDKMFEALNYLNVAKENINEDYQFYSLLLLPVSGKYSEAEKIVTEIGKGFYDKKALDFVKQYIEAYKSLGSNDKAKAEKIFISLEKMQSDVDIISIFPYLLTKKLGRKIETNKIIQ